MHFVWVVALRMKKNPRAFKPGDNKMSGLRGKEVAENSEGGSGLLENVGEGD